MRARWDVSLFDPGRPTAPIRMAFPADLTRAMRERGFNRATITVRTDGILVTPYVSKPEVAELPDWTGA